MCLVVVLSLSCSGVKTPLLYVIFFLKVQEKGEFETPILLQGDKESQEHAERLILELSTDGFSQSGRSGGSNSWKSRGEDDGSSSSGGRGGFASTWNQSDNTGGGGRSAWGRDQDSDSLKVFVPCSQVGKVIGM